MNKKAQILFATLVAAAVTAPMAAAQTAPGNSCAPKKRKVEHKKAAPCGPAKKKATEGK